MFVWFVVVDQVGPVTTAGEPPRIQATSPAYSRIRCINPVFFCIMQKNCFQLFESCTTEKKSTEKKSMGEKKIYRPEPRIKRRTSRSYAWVISLSANHTTSQSGLVDVVRFHWMLVRSQEDICLIHQVIVLAPLNVSSAQLNINLDTTFPSWIEYQKGT